MEIIVIGAGIKIIAGVVAWMAAAINDNSNGEKNNYDDASYARANALGEIRKNNKYKPKKKDPGLFPDLEEAMAYKEWMASNDSGEVNSPYYSSVQVCNKQKTKVLCFNINVNRYYRMENKFNFDLYNKDFAKAEEALNKCRQAINIETERYKKIINQSITEDDLSDKDIVEFRKNNQKIQKKYAELIKENKNISIKQQDRNINQFKSDITQKNHELQSLKEDLAKKCEISIDMIESKIGKIVDYKIFEDFKKKLSGFVMHKRSKVLFYFLKEEDEEAQEIIDLINQMGYSSNML